MDTNYILKPVSISERLTEYLIEIPVISSGINRTAYLDRDKKFYLVTGEEIDVEYWYEPIKLSELDSFKILPTEKRLKQREELDWMHPSDIALLYHKALEYTEKQNIKLQLEIKKLEDLLSATVMSDLERHNDLIEKHGEISWQIEELANNRDSEDGMSNSLFRQLVRELLEQGANKRYINSIDSIKESYCYKTYDKFLNNALKIASYGKLKK